MICRAGQGYSSARQISASTSNLASERAQTGSALEWRIPDCVSGKICPRENWSKTDTRVTKNKEFRMKVFKTKADAKQWIVRRGKPNCVVLVVDGVSRIGAYFLSEFTNDLHAAGYWKWTS